MPFIGYDSINQIKQPRAMRPRIIIIRLFADQIPRNAFPKKDTVHCGCRTNCYIDLCQMHVAANVLPPIIVNYSMGNRSHLGE